MLHNTDFFSFFQLHFITAGTRDIEWFLGEVLKLMVENGCNSNYLVKYVDGDKCNFLRIDLENGNLMIQ